MSSWGKKGSEPHDLGYFLDAVCGPVFFSSMASEAL